MSVNLKLKTPPTENPVSVSEAKTYLRIDNNIEDAEIEMMISASVSILEKYADTRFIKATYIEYQDRFPSDMNTPWFDGVQEMPISMINGNSRFVRLSQGPIFNLVSFNTYSDDGIPIPFSASNFVLDTSGPYGRVALKIGGVWPTTVLRAVNALELEYTVGLSESASGCPSAIKQAVLLMVARMYEKRGDEDVSSIPSLAMTLLEPYVRFKMLC